MTAWSRRSATFANYVCYARMGCDIVGVSADATRSSVVRRAKAALKKGEGQQRTNRFVGLELIENMMKCASGDFAAVMLFVIAYIFLLRIPSEALPHRNREHWAL